MKPTTLRRFEEAKLGSEDLHVRRAVESDLPAILALLADDPLGSGREVFDDLGPYRGAFAAIDSDPSELLVVLVLATEVIGTLQLSFIPGLSRRGASRAQIEAVRIGSDHRGQGFGRRLLEWAIAEARERGCLLVQLTTDKSRDDAHRFYERLGFVASHEGMKLDRRGPRL